MGLITTEILSLEMVGSTLAAAVISVSVGLALQPIFIDTRSVTPAVLIVATEKREA